MQIIVNPRESAYCLQCIDGTMLPFNSIHELKQILKNIAKHLPVTSLAQIFVWMLKQDQYNSIANNHIISEM